MTRGTIEERWNDFGDYCNNSAKINLKNGPNDWRMIINGKNEQRVSDKMGGGPLKTMG